MAQIIRLTLTRGQARSASDYFFPYLEELCALKIRDSASNIDENLSARIVNELLEDCMRKFAIRLLGPAQKYNFKFTLAEGIALYKLMMQLPLDTNQVWLCNIRQLITDTLHSQLVNPVAITEEIKRTG